MESTANINDTNTTGIFNEIPVKIRYTINGISITDDLKLYSDANLENAFNNYKTSKNLTDAEIRQKENVFHLIRDNQKFDLDKNKKIQELNLKEGDLIEISFRDRLVEHRNINEDNRHNIQNSNDRLNETIPSRKKNYIILFGTIILVVIAVIVFLLWYFLSYKKNKNLNKKITEETKEEPEEEEEEENEDQQIKETNKIPNYPPEDLITQKRPYYPNNTFFLYKSNKVTNIEIDSGLTTVNDEKNMTKIKQYMDFGLIIKEKHQEIDEKQGVKKNWYTGYITLLDLIVNNGTHVIKMSYNEELHDYLNEINEQKENQENNSKIPEYDSNSTIEGNQTEPLFVKINFYENGEVKDIFIPQDFYVPNMVHINAIIKYIIPKLSINLYSDNITEEIEKIDKESNQYNDTDEEEMSSDSLDIDNLENEQDIFENENSETDKKGNDKDKDGINLLRRNSENDTIDEMVEMNSINTYEISEEIEPEVEYGTSSNTEKKYHLKGIDENETETNITDFELENLESMQAKLDGSKLRKITNSFMDEKGMLFSVFEIENVTISQPPMDTIGDLTEDEDKLKSSIYNENNQIPRDDEEDFEGKNISFDIGGIRIENKNNISFVDCISDSKLTTNLFKFFDKFTYIKYDTSESNDLNKRFLKYKDELKDDIMNKNKINESEATIEIEHSKLESKKLRRMQTSESYYGLKNFEKEKVIFKYNFIGLVLAGVVVSKVDVSKGVTDSYFKLTIGFINLKTKFSSIQTNLHIIIKNTHQMTYNLMSLLHQSNEDLIERNKIYSDILIDLEKNVSKLLEKPIDYSGLFRDSLDDLYDQVKNFSGSFFNELINLIERVYDNYTVILNKTENDEYIILNEIRNVTKNEYINYIENMFKRILFFENETLTFLYNINHEVDHIQTFKLDSLYDIIDVIYDGQLVFKEFIKKLFKAVDRGVTTFKYDLRDYIEEIIGDLLYLTDFLSVNINKNEILKNAIKLEDRERVTIKLKNFRNIILRIMEILNSNIISDYEQEMSSDNENSIKSNKENSIINSIENINNRSDEVIKEIKEKIAFMNYYEIYSNNIEVINEINNKTYIEFNNDMYNNILKDITKISPEYLDKNSDLMINKNYLFSLSNDIVNVINLEINEVNEHIDLYSYKYFNERNYYLDYNLYNFREYFTDEFLNSLFNDFRLIVKESLQVHYVKIINDNYDLAYKYFEEVQKIIEEAPSYRILGTVFIKSYTKYKSTFQEMAYLASSDEFLNFIEVNFFNVSNFVLNYINKKIKSINKYFFNETQRDTFYKLDLIDQEIDRLSNNINNYFNEMKLQRDINTMITSIALNEIPALNKEKDKKMDDLYNAIYKKAEKEKTHNSNCDVIKLRIKKKRKWYWPFKYKLYYYYYCHQRASNQKNINKIISNLKVTKDYLNKKFSDFINNFINKFDVHLNYYINYSQNLYDNLYKYTNRTIHNNSNIQIILDNYQNIFNNILNNSTEEKIFERINSNYLLNGSKISDIILKFENNLFEINSKYYQNHYRNETQYFLEYPDEIILKLNQSNDILKTNVQVIKNKINLSLNERLKNIITSTKQFINYINKFNLDYIIHKIFKEDIFNEYFIHKIGFLNNFFNKILSSEGEGETENLKVTILNEENYDNPNNRIVNNYSEFISNLSKEIDDNFTFLVCPELIYSDSTLISDDLGTHNSINNTCFKERFSSDLNYSKYNFNIVKFRNGISNSRKFPELFDSLFDDLNYDNIIDSEQIKSIDDTINNKNMLAIYNKTNSKIKEIKAEFRLRTQETFDDFSKEFLNKTPELTSNYWEFLKEFKNVLNYGDVLYNSNITEVNNHLNDSINKLLENFNSTLYDSISNITNSSYYDYYSFNYTSVMSIHKNYFSLIENSFDNSISKIKNLKTNNLFYSIPKIYLNQIYLERRKKIEAMILNYSNGYDFDSIGFRYDLGKDLDTFLKKYFLSYELNNSYDYFELIENNKNEYINRLLKNISYVKNNYETKFNYIYEQFIKYLKDGLNYVENDYIKNIQRNNTRCINSIPSLNTKISYYINYTNLTEFDDYILNNCTIEVIVNALINGFGNDTCLNISEINSSTYSKEIKIILDCRDHHNYNYSYVIFEEFKEEDKTCLDEYISNITNAINSNIIDENYLNNYIQEYYIKNTTLEINIADYRLYFEDIEDMNFYVNNLREPEYKNLMNNVLIESFNMSYASIINSYIINEIINKINNLVNYKFDIFIDYYTTKLKDDGAYYSFLLDLIDELGNTSKSAIIYLFTNIPIKLNDSVYYIIEDDIYYYIDIFFRENKNIFIDNFIKFFFDDINNYNISIYKIKDYVDEMISDRNFNKSLNNISIYLIDRIKNKVKSNINNSIFSKLNLFIGSCNNISQEINSKLENIITGVMPEDMANLISLINNYTYLVSNQNSRYNFIVGNATYILLDEFINQELKPPLYLILEKYNSIEKDLLDQITAITENFPDCYSEVKEKVIGNKSDEIEQNTNQINSSLLDYEYDFKEDIEKYINKSIHYIYIDGLNTMDSSCLYYGCGIPSYNLRRLEENSILNMEKSINQDYNIINTTKISDKINKKIDFKAKRKMASLPEYSSDMGALSESDVLYHLSDLLNTTYKFNKTYFGREYNDIYLTTSKFLSKVNATFLQKLRLSFDIKLVKFSTILTKDSLQKLTNIILKQYYLIEAFIHNSSNIIQMNVDEFIKEINNTNIFIQNLAEYIYIRVLGFYKILHSSIQNKHKLIDSNKRRLEINSLAIRRIEASTLEIMKKDFSELLDSLNSEINKQIRLKVAEVLQKVYSNIDSKLKKLSDKFYKSVSFQDHFGIPIPIFPFLELVITYKIFAERGLNIGLTTEHKEDLLPILTCEAFAGAKVQLYADVGLFIPSSDSPVSIQFVVGMGGTVAHGRAGIILEFSFMEAELDLNIYFVLNAFQFEFYVKLGIYIDLLFFHTNYEFYILKYEFGDLRIRINDKKNRESMLK